MHFPLTDLSARKAFTKLTLESGTGEFGLWEVPSKTEFDLSVAHWYLPPTGTTETLVVCLSGVHGPETYAGSAIQHHWIRDLLPQVNRERIGYFFVHGLNPWGFRFEQRCTENKVNLNRNCSADSALFQLKNTESLAISKKFLRRAPVASLKTRPLEIHQEKDGKDFFGDLRVEDFIKSVGPGQFEDPEGLEFGGFRQEPQIAQLISALKSLMPKYKNILLFDLHTGLGHRGRLHLLSSNPETCVNQDLFQRLLDPQKDAAIYEFTPSSEEGFYETHGATNDLIAELATKEQRVLALTLEYGTLGHDRKAVLDGINTWLLSHQGNLYGYADENLKKEVENRNREKFCPDDETWREKVLSSASGFFKVVHQRLGAF